jgi:hypothetical protein
VHKLSKKLGSCLSAQILNFQEINKWITFKTFFGLQFPTGIVDIPAEQFETLIHKIYREAFKSEADFDNRYSIIVMVPNWDRIYEALPKGGAIPSGYRWTFNGFPTNVWIGKGKYVVMDLTSQPVYIGPALADVGVRSPISIPRFNE